MRKISIIVLFIIMVGSCSVIINRNVNLAREAERFREIQENIEVDISELNTASSIETSLETIHTYKAPPALLQLMHEYEDCIGYIDIENSNVHYPIMQHEDNEYYLRRDMEGDYSILGCIYMDSNHDIRKKGLHTIYGHNMKDGSMFADITKFVDKEYLDEHQEIRIQTDEREINLRPVYCYVDKANADYRKELTTCDQVIDFLKLHTGKEFETDDVYVLITCSYGQPDERTYLYCIPVDDK